MLTRSTLRFSREVMKGQKKVGNDFAGLILQGFGSSVNAVFSKDLPADLEKKNMNLYQAVNSAMDIALATDPT